jgi:uncharacterized membrane protein YfcA
MNMLDIPLHLVFVLTLGFSFLLAMAGKGAAAFLVPVFHWLGFPLHTAKAIALLGNTVSLSAASLDNLRSGRMDLKLGLPIIIFSVMFAPLGAYWSTLIPRDWLLWFFGSFLIYKGISLMLPKRAGAKSCQERKPKLLYLSVIGVLTGLFSGLMAVGGGGIISALMLWMGCKAKKVTVVTALAVPFSSFTGFLTYLAYGPIAWPVLLSVGSAALLGGVLGNRVAHSFVPGRYIKYGIAMLSLIFGIKIVVDLILAGSLSS